MRDADRSLVLVIGGARSGKSRFALERAARGPAPHLFVATAEARDEEMRVRIEHHRSERGARWQTVEEPLRVSEIVRGADRGTMLVDCLTLWIANLMGDAPAADLDAAIDDLVMAVAARRASVVLVANEVGLGIVPDNPLARAFRDWAGKVNQRIAAAADEVDFLVAGMPMRLK